MATLQSFLVCSYKGDVLTMATDIVQFELSVRAFDNGLLLRAKLGAIDAMAEIHSIGTLAGLSNGGRSLSSLTDYHWLRSFSGADIYRTWASGKLSQSKPWNSLSCSARSLNCCFLTSSTMRSVSASFSFLAGVILELCS
jgi:hypothetical protein